MRTRSLHFKNKPAQEHEKEKEQEHEKEKEQEKAQEKEKEKEKEQEHEKEKEQEKEEQENKEEQEKKDQWYAHYLELKKALDDHLAVKPASVDVPSDATSEPRRKMRRIYEAPVVPRECTKWCVGRFKDLPPLRVYMREPGNVSTYALDDIYEMVRQGYKIETTKPLHFTTHDYFHDIFSKLVERRPLEGGYQMKTIRNPTDVRIHHLPSESISRAYDGVVLAPENDPWWSAYDKDTMVTILTLRGPVHGLKSELENREDSNGHLGRILGFNFVHIWLLYSYAWSVDECAAARYWARRGVGNVQSDYLKSEHVKSDHPKEEKLEEMGELLKSAFYTYIENVHTHRQKLLEGRCEHLKWGLVTDMLPVNFRF